MMDLLIPIAILAAVVAFLVASTIRIVPQARRYNIERFGRYQRTLQPGLNLIIPLVDRVNTKLDVREQVYSSDPKPVITADNLVVSSTRSSTTRSPTPGRRRTRWPTTCRRSTSSR